MNNNKYLLRICPVCNNKVEIVKGDDAGFFIVCSKCCMSYGVAPGLTRPGSLTINGDFETEDELINEWNNAVEIYS